MAARAFDPYEYVAVVAPGAVVALGLATNWPEFRVLLADRGLTVGGFGLFLVVSFVIGHVIQALGNMLESALWRLLGGMPSSWVRRPDQDLLSPAQRQRLFARLEQDHGQPVDPADMGDNAWDAVVREIYSKVNKANRSERVDAFNRTYGLLRGLSAGFFVLGGLVAVTEPGQVEIAVAAIAAALAAAYRMYRFGRSYARELFVEYLATPALTKPAS